MEGANLGQKKIRSLIFSKLRIVFVEPIAESKSAPLFVTINSIIAHLITFNTLKTNLL
jgi:hypothetical protein